MWESCLFLVIIKVIKRRVGIMLQKQQTMILSPYTEIYDLVVPKDNFLRRLNELIDLSFVYDELNDKYCHTNGRNAIDPISMFKYYFLNPSFTYLLYILWNVLNMICHLNFS